jgi:hypothetical protein
MGMAADLPESTAVDALDFARAGLSDEEIAGRLGVTRSRMRSWRMRNPSWAAELTQARRLAKRVMDADGPAGTSPAANRLMALVFGRYWPVAVIADEVRLWTTLNLLDGREQLFLRELAAETPLSVQEIALVAAVSPTRVRQVAGRAAQNFRRHYLWDGRQPAPGDAELNPYLVRDEEPDEPKE